MEYDPTIYAGAAAHYRPGRPPYSPQLESVLAEELNLDGSGRLLDGGCGPGILTVRLAHLFEEAVGLDPDPGMLDEGRRAADAAGLPDIRWVQARAEELPEAAPGPYRLVTFGQSLHWTDEARVAEAVYDMLEPGGALALTVHTVEGRPRRGLRKVLGRRFHPPDVRDPSFVGDPPAFGEHRRVGVEADHILEQVGEPDGENAGPAAAVEQPPMPVQPQFLRENGLELRRVRGPAEPVVDRGTLEQRWVVGRHSDAG